MKRPTEEQIANDLIIAGEDPRDPLARALYVEAWEASQPVAAEAKAKPFAGQSMMGRVSDASSMSHGDLAAIVGISRAAIQAYASGRLEEHYTRDQLRRLQAALEDQLKQLSGVVKDIASALQGS